MRNILIIARKELLSTFRQRNLLLIMFLSPIVLVAIMGLAFGGLGDSSAPAFADIRIAVVNQDQGFTLQQQFPTSNTTPSLNDLDITINGQSVNLGEQLQQNPNVDSQDSLIAPSDFSLNFGNTLAAVLLSQPLTGTGMISGAGGGFDLNALECPLLPADEQGQDAFAGSLDDLFDAEAVSDPAVALAGVEEGEYVAAVIIPPDFSKSLAPDFGFNSTTPVTPTSTVTGTVTGVVEVIANNATPIGASIVRAVVEGIVGQFERMNVALSALALTTIDTIVAIDINDIDPNALDPTVLNLNTITNTLQKVDATVLAPLGCLIMPGASNIQLEQQPLGELQTRSTFSILMVMLGGAQAVFFALFTGVFGINSIYEDRRQGTLQRVLVAPVSSSQVLFGRLLGNLVIVACQLLILLLAFTTIATVVEGELTFIWGTNLPALLAVILGLSLFTTGMGVLIVGLANSSEQVQLIGPLVTLLLGALGGTFGAVVPDNFAQFSPTWWGINAMGKLAANEGDIALNLLVLFGVGLVFAVVGTFFFRRRMEL
jgi:ABC-type Na+ efflux pump permease subunit